MAMQIRIDRDKAPSDALRRHLSASQLKKLRKKQHLVITCDGNRRQAGRMRQELNAIYVS